MHVSIQLEFAQVIASGYLFNVVMRNKNSVELVILRDYQPK